nr:dockerin type I domain-containing protein [Thalassolituus pacificus]
MNATLDGTGNHDFGQIELLAGDINQDGAIDIADFTFLSGRYGTQQGEESYVQAADLNKDTVINVQDLAILASHFGSQQCNP